MKVYTLLFLTSLIFSLNALHLSIKKTLKKSKTRQCFDDFLCSNPPKPSTPMFTVRGYIRNAATNAVFSSSDLQSLHIIIGFNSNSQNYTAIIDYVNSIYSVTMPAGFYQRSGSLDTYIPTTTSVNVSANATENDNQNSILFAPIFVGWRAVLTWSGSIDKDLDSYTKCPDGTLVYYKKKDSADGVVHFDVDSRDSGPETSNYAFTVSSNGVWSFYVNSYSKQAPLFKSAGKVVIYHGSNQVSEVKIPESGTTNSVYWHVFDLNVKSNVQIYQEINQLASSM